MLERKADHAHVEMGQVRRNGGMQLSKLPYLFICLYLSFSFPDSCGAVEGVLKGTLQDLRPEAQESDFKSWVAENKFIREDDSKTDGDFAQVSCNLFFVSGFERRSMATWLHELFQFDVSFSEIIPPCGLCAGEYFSLTDYYPRGDERARRCCQCDEYQCDILVQPLFNSTLVSFLSVLGNFRLVEV